MLTLASLLASGTNIFSQQIANGVITGAMYALVALGYTLVYGIIELINFAHGDVFMWSTVIIFVVVGRMGLSQSLTGLALVGVVVLLLVVGMAFSGILNATIERVAYRRLRKAPRLAPLIAAIGCSFILETIVALWLGTNFYAFPTIFPTGGIDILGAHLTYVGIFIVLMALLMMYGLDRFIRLTRLGRAMRATAQDPEAASLMGVNINQTISLTFLIGGALAGAAGLAYNMYVGQVWFLTGFQLGLIAFTAAVLGGIGNIYGAVLGGFLIGLIDSLAIQFIPDGFAWSLAVVFAILVLILVFRPSGLLGQQVPDKV
jgi:branched-chain amino acid transport system permease protein